MRAGADKSQAQVAAELEDYIVAVLTRHGAFTLGDLLWKISCLKDSVSWTPEGVAAALRRLRTRGRVTVSASHPRLWRVDRGTSQEIR